MAYLKENFCALLITFFFSTQIVLSQSTGINNVNPNNKAALDIQTAAGFKQGFIMPRLTTADTNNIGVAVNRDKGLMFFDTLVGDMRFWNGTKWKGGGSNSGTPNIWTKTGTNIFQTTLTDYVGIGTPNPSSLFSVGSNNQFQVNTSGDIVSIKGISYTWPAAQSSGTLTNDGTGILTWGSGSGATGSGTLNSLPIWTGTSSLGNSALKQTGTGVTASVSVGNAAPNALFGKFYVMSDGNDNAIRGESSTTGTNNTGVFGLAAAASTAAIGVQGTANGTSTTTGVSALAYGTGTNAYGLYASSTGGSTNAYGVYSIVSGATNNYAGVFMGGNVGIGTDIPVAKLDVIGDISANGLMIFSLPDTVRTPTSPSPNNYFYAFKYPIYIPLGTTKIEFRAKIYSVGIFTNSASTPIIRIGTTIASSATSFINPATGFLADPQEITIEFINTASLSGWQNLEIGNGKAGTTPSALVFKFMIGIISK